MRIPTTIYTIAFCCAVAAVTQAQQEPKRFTRADTLRGSNGPARAWWDAEFYDLHVRVNPADSSISGRNESQWVGVEWSGFLNRWFSQKVCVEYSTKCPRLLS